MLNCCSYFAYIQTVVYSSHCFRLAIDHKLFSLQHLVRMPLWLLCAGLELTMAAMAAKEWEVRNAANMTFTALLNRMLGFKNLAKVRPACILLSAQCLVFLFLPVCQEFWIL